MSDGDAFSEIHRQYFHSDDQVSAALAECRLRLLAHTDEYTDDPVEATTLRATWTARLAVG